MGWQEIDVYVVTATAVYVYDAKANALERVVVGDCRVLTGTQPFVQDAPVTLVCVANIARMTLPSSTPRPLRDAEEAYRDRMEWADAAVISENVYIFAASEGLATGVRALIERPTLAKAL